MSSAYRFTRSAIKRTRREWTEAIGRDYSHPCVIEWVPFNESWGLPELTAMGKQRHAVEGLYHLTKTLDATRPVIGNDGWESTATDIIGIHDYDANMEHPRQPMVPKSAWTSYLTGVGQTDGFLRSMAPHRGQPIMLTEFGGIAFAKCPQSGIKQVWGYSTVEDVDEFARIYGELMQTVIHTSLFSGFCYTQFANTFQEANGLLCTIAPPRFQLKALQG